MNFLHKPRVLITLTTSKIGGPYISHKRIINSPLSQDYVFIPWSSPRLRQMLSLRYYHRLKRYISQTQPDIIHITGLQLDGFIQMLLFRIITKDKLPLILAIHGSSSEALDISKLKKNIIILFEKWTLRHCDNCYGVSQYVVNWPLVQKNAKRCYGHIYNIPESSKTQLNLNNRQSVRRQLGFQEDDIVVTTTGRITMDKGFDILLKLIINGAYIDKVRFLIVGDGSFLNMMRSEIERNKVKNVVFTGHISDVGRMLAASDIFIICTKHETLCNSIIEAGHYRLPVIASKVGGIPEIIGEGRGHLFEVGDIQEANRLLSELVFSPVLRKKYGDALFEHIAKYFNEKVNMDKLNDVYQSSLNLK